MKKPKITVATLNYNASEATIEFIESLKKQTYKNFDVLVIDNNSQEDDFNKLRHYYKRIKGIKIRLIRLEKNLGNSAGLNTALDHIKTAYILFSDNDIVLDKNCIELLIEPFLSGKYKRIAVTTPTILNYYNGGLYSGRNYLNAFGQANRLNRVYSDENQPVKMLSGACFIIKKSVLNDVGHLYCSEYFAYYEDVDLAWRIYNKKYQQIYVPKAIVRHKIGTVSKKHKRMRIFLFMLNSRNKYLTFYRNLTGFRFLLILNVLLFFDFMKFLKLLVRGEIKKSLAIPLSLINFLLIINRVKYNTKNGFSFLGY